MNNVNHLLQRINSGDRSASDDLLPLVYDELRQLARARMASGPPGQTLQPTALVHEAWLRLVANGNHERDWENRGHFFAAAANAMRCVLIDRARAKGAAKRGGSRKRVFLDSGELAVTDGQVDVLDLEDALRELEKQYPDHAAVVQLKFFSGLEHQSIAVLLAVSESTVRRRWRFAKAWLHRHLEERDGE